MAVSEKSAEEKRQRAHTQRGCMNLRQALAVSSHHLACRQVGDRRVIVDRGREFLTVHLQRRLKRRWVVDDSGGGVLRDGLGHYLSLCQSDDLSDIERIRALLPLCSQALLIPSYDDWHALAQDDL